MAIQNYQEFQTFINGVLSANGQMQDTEQRSPHRAWWNTMSYEEFIASNVPNVGDPNTGAPMPTLVVGQSAASNLILALQGAPNTPFDPNTGAYGQMPADGPPFFTEEQIAEIAAWIDAGCPNGSTEASAAGATTKY